MDTVVPVVVEGEKEEGRGKKEDGGRLDFAAGGLTPPAPSMFAPRPRLS